VSRNRASEIVGNTNFSEIDTLLSQGHDMDYIARHYNMDLPLALPPPARHRSRPKEADSTAQGFRSGEAGGRNFESTSVLKEKPDKCNSSIFRGNPDINRDGFQPSRE